MANIGTAVAGFVALLEKEFSIDVIDKDIQEDIPRPSFVLQVENITRDKIGALPHDNFDLEIWYFAPKREQGYAGLYGIMQRMQELFGGDYVSFADGYKIPVEVMEYDLDRKDMTLLTTLNIDMVYDYIEQGECNMETLNNNVNL